MKLVLGTAQFGLDYGIANHTGRVHADEVGQILRCAASHGITTLDTAVAYGDSERVLGEAGVKEWQVISKLPGVPDDCRDVAGWVEQTVDTSLSRLDINSLDGLLLHRPLQLLEPMGEQLIAALCRLQSTGRVARLGLSVYDVDSLDLLMERLPCNVIQVPFSILDQRLIQSGWAERLRAAGVEIHARSIFLQGLLVMPAHQRPRAFDPWSQTFRDWDYWLQQTGRNPLEACLQFALTSDAVDHIVVGIDSLDQLQQLVSIAPAPLSDLPVWHAPPSPYLVNPSLWNTL